MEVEVDGHVAIVNIWNKDSDIIPKKDLSMILRRVRANVVDVMAKGDKSNLITVKRDDKLYEAHWIIKKPKPKKVSMQGRNSKYAYGAWLD
jgi:signal-transduction protein with cAMP-binding, CBS, and nucleotidyltransferase domain